MTLCGRSYRIASKTTNLGEAHLSRAQERPIAIFHSLGTRIQRIGGNADMGSKHLSAQFFSIDQSPDAALVEARQRYSRCRAQIREIRAYAD
jgi:hypothetical protein